MDKNYVVEGALVSCEFGCELCELKTLSHRHVTEAGSNVANETDYTKECIKGFGECRSSFRINSPESPPQGVTSIHQLGGESGGAKECQPEISIPWQNSKEDVKIGLYRALMEEGWTICTKGFGIITLTNSGQKGQITLQQLLENLKLLQKAVAQYVRTNQISDKYKKDLLESILLWKGYADENIFWDYKSNDLKNEFCKYLAINDPSLYGFFERKLEITASDGEKVDVSYMMGLYEALQQHPKDYFSLNGGFNLMPTDDVIANDAMFNAFLEAGMQKPDQSLSQMLENYLKGELNSSGNNNRYDNYLSGYSGKEEELEWNLNQGADAHKREEAGSGFSLNPEVSQNNEADSAVKNFMEKFHEKRGGAEGERS